MIITPVKFNRFEFAQQKNNFPMQNSTLKPLMGDCFTFTGKQKEVNEDYDYYLDSVLCTSVSDNALTFLDMANQETLSTEKGSYYYPKSKVLVTKEKDNLGNDILKKYFQNGTEMTVKRYKDLPSLFVKINRELEDVHEYGQIFLEDHKGIDFFHRGRVTVHTPNFNNEFLKTHMRNFVNSKCGESIKLSPEKMETITEKIKLFQTIKKSGYQEASKSFGYTEAHCRQMVYRNDGQHVPDFDKMILDAKMPARMDLKIQEIIVDKVIENPYVGSKTMTAELRKKGIKVSPQGILNTLKRGNPDSIKKYQKLITKNRQELINCKKLDLPHKIADKEKIQNFLLGHPWWSAEIMSEKLQSEKIMLSQKQIAKIWKQNNIETPEKRIALAQLLNVEIKGNDKALELIKLAEEIGPEAACLKTGFLEYAYYRFKITYDANKGKFVPDFGETYTRKNYYGLAPEVENSILDVVKQNPNIGPKLILKELKKQGVTVGLSGIINTLEREGLETIEERLEFLEKNNIKIDSEKFAKATQKARCSANDAEEKALMELCLPNPWWGVETMSEKLKELGIDMGKKVIYGIWLRNGLETPEKRLAHAEANNIEINGNQKAAELIKLAEEIGTMAACKQMNISKSSYLRYKKAYEESGRKYVPNYLTIKKNNTETEKRLTDKTAETISDSNVSGFYLNHSNSEKDSPAIILNSMYQGSKLTS